MTGVLLINLGTPDSPRPRDVRRYLREFLSDGRVLDIHPVARWLLLHAVILPFRPRRSAAAYEKIWRADGSPLLVFGRALRDAVAQELGDGFRVELGMRYGSPSIADALAALREAQVSQLVVLPLFPQYSAAVTGSVLARTFADLVESWDLPAVHVAEPFYEHPAFIDAYAATAREPLAGFRADHVLFSYHGLPERQIRRSVPESGGCLTRPECCDAISSDNQRCYRAQCFATTRALARALALPQEMQSVAFQSRLGRTPWIEPYTDKVLPELARHGVKRLAVLCPAFVADCLETLEEIGIRAREQWRDAGGEELLLVPCPNAHPTWVAGVSRLVREGLPAQSASSSRAATLPDSIASGTETPAR